jgi:hypothetical protein
MGQVIQLPNGQTAQIIDSPSNAYGAPLGPNGQYLPPFSQVAASVESHASRVPWYFWLGVGAYVGWKYIRKP